jgi:signal transduction histidine kinase/tetratricopeptide (TPR) repeat protein
VSGAALTVTAMVPAFGRRYRVLSELGRGAMGTVWRVWDEVLEREVALKVLTSAASDPAELVVEFRAAAALRHPHVIRLFDLSVNSAAGPFFTMELLSAQPISGAGGPDATIRLAVQALSALVYLERHGLSHGDLKPTNLLVDDGPDPAVHLVDFGLSLQGAEGAISGTPAYLPPERARGAAQDARGDLYSLGVVLYEALSGANPFLAETAAASISRHVRLVPEPLHRTTPGIDPAISGFVSRLLEKSPERRPATAADALATLLSLVADSPLASSPSVVAPPLVGRPAAQSAVQSTLRAARVGRGSALVLSGPAGTGRTELCESARIQAQVVGLPCAILRCRPGRDTPAALASAVALALDAHGSDCDPNDVDAIAACILSAATRPLALVVDDADRADPALAVLLARLVEGIDWTSLALVIVVADRERPARVASAVVAAQSRRAASHVALTALGASETTALVETALGAPIDPDTLGEMIHSATGGIPALALDLLRHLASTGGLSLRDGIFVATRALDASEGATSPIETLLAMRFDALEPAAQAILLAVAVLDAPASPALVAHVASQPLKSTRALLSALATAGFIRRDERDFAYPAHSELAAAVRTRVAALRWMAGNRLALTRLQNTKTAPEILARHARGAGAHDEAVALGLQAAQLAAVKGDLPSQVRELTALHALLAGHDDGPLRLPIAARLGLALEQLGRHAEAEPHLEIAHAAAEELPAEIPALRVLCALTAARARLGKQAEALESVEALLSLADAAGNRIDAVRARLQVAQVFRVASNPTRAREILDSTSEIELPPAQAPLMAEVRRELATLGWQQGRPEEAAAHAEAAISLCEGVGDTLGVAHGQMALGTSRRVAGDFAAATSLYELAANSYALSGALAQLGKARNNAAVACYMGGDWGKAAELWEEAIRVAELTGDRAEQMILGNNLGYMFIERGALERAEQAFERALSHAGGAESKRVTVIIAGNLAETRALQGRAAEAYAGYADAIALAEEIGADSDIVENRRRRAELALDDGALDRALTEATEALARARELDLRAEVVHLARIRGTALLRQGQLEAATEALATAAEATDDENLDAARLDMARAELALAQSDVDTALGIAGRAVAAFERCQAVLFLERSRGLLDRIERAAAETRASSSTPSPLGAVLTRLTDLWDAEACAAIVLETAVGLIGAARGTVYVPPTREHVSLRISQGIADRSGSSWDGRIDAFSRTVASQVLDHRQPVCLQNVDEDASIAAAASVLAMNLRSILCVPIPLEGGVTGLIYADSAHHIDNDLAAILPEVERLALLLGLALDRIRMRERLVAQHEVVSIVAHEMRTPIAAVAGFAELAQWKLQGVELPELVTTLIRVTASEGERMKRLVSDIQQLGQAWSYELKETVATDPALLIEQATSVLGRNAADAGVSWKVVIEPELAAAVVDTRRIQQVFINLLSNALRYAPEGTSITITAAREGFAGRVGERRMLRFSVKDEGPGISTADAAQIFRKFNRGSSPRGDGSGLGLNIAQSIVQAHGGTIWVDATPAAGCCFHFTVPTV